MDIIGSADLGGDRQWHRQHAGEEIHQHGGTQARGVGDDGVLVGEEISAPHPAVTLRFTVPAALKTTLSWQ